MTHFPSVGTGRHTATEATRLLAAGTYLNPVYRETVLDSTVRSPARFVSPSFGVDIAMVVRHALVAHRRAAVRDLLLLFDLIGLVVVVLHGLASAGSDLGGGGLLGEPGATDSGGGGHSLIALLILAVVAAGVAFADELIRTDTLAKSFVRGRNPDTGPMPGGPQSAEQIQSMRSLTEGNVVVFSSRKPFVGSGARLERNTAAIPLQGVLVDPERAKTGEDRERRRRDPQQFDERELLDRLSEALRTLDLPGMRVQERIYVNGVDAGLVFDGRLIRGGHRPTAHASELELKEAVADPLGAARHYLCAEITSWHGHLVSTTFIRVLKLPEMLYVETAAHVLPPLQDSFFAVDRPEVVDEGIRVSHAIGAAVRNTVPLLLHSPAAMLRAIGDANRPARQLARYKAARRNQLIVDQGAVTSIREAASIGTRPGIYFLDRDMLMQTETIAARVSETLREFMAEHGYDIGELNFSQNVALTSITNHGSIGAVGTGAHGEVKHDTAAAPTAS